jgi:lipopolysaccharide/colanic/teichoic acid biosynthesis glycosyltransferase
MANECGSTPVIVTDTGRASGFIGVYKPHEDRHHTRYPAGVAKAKLRRGGTRPLPAPHQAQWHDSVLHSENFAEAVHRETRRSERSGAPLSIVRYAIDSGASGDTLHFERLLGILQASKRETDFLGHISTDAFAILCPDTDSAGARGLIAKLVPLVADMPVLPASATFPDHLFESLAGCMSAGEAFQLFTAPAPPVDRLGHYSLKRSLDFISAMFALLVFGPLMLAIALIVRLTSKGPVIFRQQRLGKGGIPFTFYKFRSMVVDVDDRIHREYMANLIRGGQSTPPPAGADADAPSYKMKADPRVTTIGRFIRMTSIDELPQLFNVLKGDMSMVGPRPPIPYEAAHYEPWHLRRILIAKPGITGLWQVDGRSRVTFSEMVRMDLRYIRHCSLALDLIIMVKTVGVVLRCSGAR